MCLKGVLFASNSLSTYLLLHLLKSDNRLNTEWNQSQVINILVFLQSLIIYKRRSIILYSLSLQHGEICRCTKYITNTADVITQHKIIHQPYFLTYLPSFLLTTNMYSILFSSSFGHFHKLSRLFIKLQELRIFHDGHFARVLRRVQWLNERI